MRGENCKLRLSLYKLKLSSYELRLSLYELRLSTKFGASKKKVLERQTQTTNPGVAE